MLASLEWCREQEGLLGLAFILFSLVSRDSSYTAAIQPVLILLSKK